MDSSVCDGDGDIGTVTRKGTSRSSYQLPRIPYWLANRTVHPYHRMYIAGASSQRIKAFKITFDTGIEIVGSIFGNISAHSRRNRSRLAQCAHVPREHRTGMFGLPAV